MILSKGVAMFTKIRLKNFLSLTDFEADFEKKKNTPLKLILVYGENGAGKSNLVKAFFTLLSSIESLSTIRMLESIRKEQETSANSEAPERLLYIIKKMQSSFGSMSDLAEELQTAGSPDPVSMEFGFIVDGKSGAYAMSFDKSGLLSESLTYTLNKRKVKCYEVKDSRLTINTNLFTDTGLKRRACTLFGDYTGKYTFLSILEYLRSDLSENAFRNKVAHGLLSIMDSFGEIPIWMTHSQNFRVSKYCDSNFLDDWQSDLIEPSQENILDEQEEILNRLVPMLNADIQSVRYKKERQEDKLKYTLYFRKNIGGTLRDISYRNESSGTQQLMRILPFLLCLLNGQTVIIDEFDTGIHDLLVMNLMTSLYPYIKGQLIVTTHDTVLMETDIPGDSFFVLDIDSDRQKRLVPLSKCERLYANLNKRNRYLNGFYGGIPITDNIDFDSIMELYEKKQGTE